MDGDNLWPLTKLSTYTLPPRSHQSKKWHRPVRATLGAQVESRITRKSSSYHHRTRQPNLSLWSFPIHWLKKEKKKFFQPGNTMSSVFMPQRRAPWLSHPPPHRHKQYQYLVNWTANKQKKKSSWKIFDIDVKGAFFLKATITLTWTKILESCQNPIQYV